MTTTDARPRDRVTTLLECRLLRSAAFAFVSYKAVYDGLTAGAGLVDGAAASAAAGAGLCAALLLCGRLPVAVAALALGGFLLESQLWPLLFALYCVTLLRPALVAVGLTALAFGPAAHAPFRELVNMPQVSFLPCAVVALPLAFGLAARSHRRLARSLARQLDHLRTANRLRDERVRLAERARIAREMHDVLAHRLSLLVLHTGVLQRRGAEAPEAVRERLGLLRDTSAHALDDLRDLLGALRDHEGPAPLGPTADDLPSLIAESEAAGTRVRGGGEGAGELAALPAAVRLAVHRIVQEALTNARKHAPGEPVDLAVTVERSRSRVEIRAANACPPQVTSPGAPRGYGLVGVGERVAALHGELTSGRTDDGRFVLRARLPIPPHPSSEGLSRHPVGEARQGAGAAP
ncbi:sensor histidine kinase [Streptomyces sp. NPDC051217]|uniref:sensor histidine kinase n=1 Tax=Streptomyces sp. NPDC051217 TaxID=3365644 RepID=UPI0037B0A822